MSVPWSTESLTRMIQLTGKLSQLYERLKEGAQVEHEEMVQATQHLEQLQALSAVPGAMQMHEKYLSLLHPYLQSYGLTSGAAPPAWEQDKAMQMAFNSYQQSVHNTGW